MTYGYLALAIVYGALTTLIFVHARKRGRRMSWAEYIVYAPISLVLGYFLFMLSVVVG